MATYKCFVVFIVPLCIILQMLCCLYSLTLYYLRYALRPRTYLYMCFPVFRPKQGHLRGQVHLWPLIQGHLRGRQVQDDPRA